MKYNKWTSVEESLLLTFMLEGIKQGSKIKELLVKFSDTYSITVTSAKSKWQLIAKQNRLAVEIAKYTWTNEVKPELEEKEKQKIEQLRLNEESKLLRKKWNQEKKKKSLKLNFKTGKLPQSPRVYYTVDNQGVVAIHKTS